MVRKKIFERKEEKKIKDNQKGYCENGELRDAKKKIIKIEKEGNERNK